jgi:pyridoxal phosphate enzyme (YggS family)
MYQSLKRQLDLLKVTLVAVSKIQPVEAIQKLYDLGQRDFGENYVQELLHKKEQLPAEIRWHFIGHLQTNKVKQLLGHVQLIQGVDSLKLLKEIDKQAGKLGIVQDCLLQVHIAREETKFGLSEEELNEILAISGHSGTDHIGFPNVRVRGLMGMASLDAGEEEIAREFAQLGSLYKSLGNRVDILSMGMSGDYEIAIKNGSNMVRIGSLLFGARR